jgi:hypothetical protein
VASYEPDLPLIDAKLAGKEPQSKIQPGASSLGQDYQKQPQGQGPRNVQPAIHRNQEKGITATDAKDTRRIGKKSGVKNGSGVSASGITNRTTIFCPRCSAFLSSRNLIAARGRAGFFVVSTLSSSQK